MYLERLWIDSAQTQYDYGYCWILHIEFHTSLIDLGLDSRSQECNKAKTSPPIISQSFLLTWMEFGVRVGEKNLLKYFFFYLIHLVLKEENTTYVILFKKTIKVACFQTFTDFF